MSGGAAASGAGRGRTFRTARGLSWRAQVGVIAAALVFIVGAVAPTHVVGEFALRLGNEGLLLGMLALSVAFLMNQAGLVALGAASVYGGAGYLFSIAISEWDMTATEALLFSFVVVVIYAAILGALIVRTNPLAFMMLTLAAGEMISHGVMLEGLRDYTGGADGLVVGFKGSILGMQAADFANAARFWPVAWTAAWIAGLIVWAVRRSRLGAILRAVRENEERMRFSGFDTYAPRLIAFVLINAIAAASGLLARAQRRLRFAGQPEPFGQHQRAGGCADGGSREFYGSNRRRTDFRVCAGRIRRSRRHSALHRRRGRGVHRPHSARGRRRNFGCGAAVDARALSTREALRCSKSRNCR